MVIALRAAVVNGLFQPRECITVRVYQMLLIAIFSAAISAGIVTAATATEMVYTGSVNTEVQLGAHRWHNADVTFRFVGDTKDLEHFDPSTNSFAPGCGSSDLYCAILTGKFSVTIAKGDYLVTRTFRPGQVVVGFDFNNDGLGFGAFIGPNGFEPAYPFGLDSGTTDCCGSFPAPDSTSNQTGKVYSCIGFMPGNYSCADPTQYPLETTDGESFAIFMPYYNQVAPGVLDSHFSFGSLNVGFFTMAPAPEE